MSLSDSTAKGKWNEFAGKAKQAFGEATGDQSAANNGAAQEVKGQGEQALGSVKEAAHDTGERNEPTADAHAHNLRQGVTSAAANIKKGVENAADGFKNK